MGNGMGVRVRMVGGSAHRGSSVMVVMMMMRVRSACSEEVRLGGVCGAGIRATDPVYDEMASHLIKT